jgi:tetratricopeptide (TPR) repeat protein
MNIAALMPTLQRAQAMLQARQAGQAWLALAPLRPAIDRHGQALRLYALVAQEVGRSNDALDALRRIASLEGDPPEILGAIADTLGRAGQHREAYEAWTLMVGKYPGIVEAHLNRAIAATHCGLHEEAVAAADEALSQFPGDARLLATKAMALKNANRIGEALDLFTVAVAADPELALTHHNLAVTLRAACRFEEACEAYEEAERLGAGDAQFYANWAAAALEADKVGQAEELYRKSLERDPALDEARKGLTRLKIEYRGGEGAFAHYEEAVRRQPRDPQTWLDWSRRLIANRRMEAALEVAEEGLAVNPHARGLMAIRSFVRGMTGNAAAALQELDDLLRDEPKESPVRSLITQIAFRAGHPERAAEILEVRAMRNPKDQLAWAMLAVAWRMLDDPREHWLCDYERFVMVTDVPPPDGLISAPEYAREVAAMLDPLHVTTAEPGDKTLRGGTQTSGSLFSRPDPAVQRFRRAVELAAAKMVADLPDDPDHPFLSRKSTRFGFSGSWSVRLAAGGHHVSHAHPKGWMSSAYYARLPRSNEGAAARQEGWIRFGLPPDHLGIDLPPRRVVEPKVGRLVLFPSYMWHGTIPFEDGDRLTAAFDYQPL